MQQATIRTTFGCESYPPRTEMWIFSRDNTEVPLRRTPTGYSGDTDLVDADLKAGEVYWVATSGLGYVVVERGIPTCEGPWQGNEVLDVGGTIEGGKGVIGGDAQSIAEMPLAALARVKKELRYLVKGEEERAALAQLGIMP